MFCRSIFVACVNLNDFNLILAMFLHCDSIVILITNEWKISLLKKQLTCIFGYLQTDYLMITLSNGIIHVKKMF